MKNTIYLIMLMLSCTGGANAATVSYEARHIAGNHWEYTYTVKNDGLYESINEFSVYFEPTLYHNLSTGASPKNWDTIVNEPDKTLPAKGFYDSLALKSGIANGKAESGFTVAFDYVGTGAPGKQPYDILDPSTLVSLKSGNTISSVPLPNSFGLFGAGLAFLSCFLLQRQRQHGAFCN